MTGVECTLAMYLFNRALNLDVERGISFLLQKHQQHYYEWHVFMLTSWLFCIGSNNSCIYELCQSLASTDLCDNYSEMKVLI